MRSVVTTKRTIKRTTRRLIGSVVFLSAMSWANFAHAQFAVGSTWVRTDALGKGITLTIEACCNGGLRLIYKIPNMGDQPAVTMTVDSPMDGTEVPSLIGGKPSGQTMAARRVDDSSLHGGCEDGRNGVWNVQRHSVPGRQDDDGRDRHPGRRQIAKGHRDVGEEISDGTTRAVPPQQVTVPAFSRRTR